MKLITFYLPREDVALLLKLLNAIEIRTDEEEELRRFLEDVLLWNHAK